MNTFKNIIAALLIAGAAAIPAAATVQAQSPVTLEGDVMAVKTVTDADGNQTTQLVAPDVIVPGDRLLFTTQYANNGAEPADNFVITNQVPAAVRLAPDASAELTVSVDGGTTWGELSTLTVTDESGATRAATGDDVTHIRWTLASIAPGETGSVEYPAIIR